MARVPILDETDRVPQRHLPAHLTPDALVESTQDVVGAMLVAGANVTLAYNDTAGTLTISAVATGGGGTGGLDAESVQDVVAAALRAGPLMGIAYDDAANTITITTTATANSSDAALLNRANHTGTQTAATISNLTETVQDIVGAMVVAGANMTVAYDDPAGTITFTSTGGGTATPGGSTGTVLTVADISGLAEELQKSPVVITYGTGPVPLRSQFLTDTSRVAIWNGDAQPAISANGEGGYAVDNVDIWLR